MLNMQCSKNIRDEDNKKKNEYRKMIDQRKMWTLQHKQTITMLQAGY